MPYLLESLTPSEACDYLLEETISGPYIINGSHNQNQFTELDRYENPDFTMSNSWFSYIYNIGGNGDSFGKEYINTVPLNQTPFGKISAVACGFISVRCNTNYKKIRPTLLRYPDGILVLWILCKSDYSQSEFRSSEVYNKLASNNIDLVSETNYTVRAETSNVSNWYWRASTSDFISYQSADVHDGSGSLAGIKVMGSAQYGFVYPGDITNDRTGYKIKGNIPIFNYDDTESIRAWAENGDRSGELHLPDSDINYKLHADVVEKDYKFYNSIFKLTWNSDNIPETDISGYTIKIYPVALIGQASYEPSMVKQIAIRENNPINELPFSNGNYTFTLKEIIDFTNSAHTSNVFCLYISDKINSKDIYIYINREADIKENLIPEYGVFDSQASIEVLFDSGDDDEGYTPKEDSDDGGGSDGDNEFSTSGSLTTTYAVSLSRLKALGQFIWSDSIFDNIKLINNSPIENIVSIKAFPFSLSGTDTTIELGNVNTGVNGGKLSNSTWTSPVYSATIPKKNSSEFGFLNYEPYTTVALHLPYIGFVELDTSCVMGNVVKVKYIVDLITGACKAMVMTKIKNNSDRVINEYNGQMGIDVPITASNRAQVESSHIAAGIGVAASIAGFAATSGVTAAAGMSQGISNMMIANNASAVGRGVVGSIINSALAQYHYNTTGSGSPNMMSASGANRKIYCIISRPIVDISAKFNHTHGRPCNLTRTIKNCKGFTLCNPNIELGEIPCTVAEKEEIISILSTGFFAEPPTV